jgi:hypothetical protein
LIAVGVTGRAGVAAEGVAGGADSTGTGRFVPWGTAPRWPLGLTGAVGGRGGVGASRIAGMNCRDTSVAAGGGARGGGGELVAGGPDFSQNRRKRRSRLSVVAASSLPIEA